MVTKCTRKTSGSPSLKKSCGVSAAKNTRTDIQPHPNETVDDIGRDEPQPIDTAVYNEFRRNNASLSTGASNQFGAQWDLEGTRHRKALYLTVVDFRMGFEKRVA